MDTLWIWIVGLPLLALDWLWHLDWGVISVCIYGMAIVHQLFERLERIERRLGR